MLMSSPTIFDGRMKLSEVGLQLDYMKWDGDVWPPTNRTAVLFAAAITKLIACESTETTARSAEAPSLAGLRW